MGHVTPLHFEGAAGVERLEVAFTNNPANTAAERREPARDRAPA
jgi:hypothetical protein